MDVNRSACRLGVNLTIALLVAGTGVMTTELGLLHDREPSVRLEAARSLRVLSTNPTVLTAAKKKLLAIQDDERETRLRSQLEFLTDPENVARPSTVKDWQDLLGKGGDPDAGRSEFQLRRTRPFRVQLDPREPARPGPSPGPPQ